MDDNGVPYNINADTAAAEIAIALHAEKLVSMTDIVGLLYDKNDESTLIPEVEVSEIEVTRPRASLRAVCCPRSRAWPTPSIRRPRGRHH